MNSLTGKISSFLMIHFCFIFLANTTQSIRQTKNLFCLQITLTDRNSVLLLQIHQTFWCLHEMHRCFLLLTTCLDRLCVQTKWAGRPQEGPTVRNGPWSMSSGQDLVPKTTTTENSPWPLQEPGKLGILDKKRVLEMLRLQRKNWHVFTKMRRPSSSSVYGSKTHFKILWKIHYHHLKKYSHKKSINKRLTQLYSNLTQHKPATLSPW